MLADFFTKPLQGFLFKRFRDVILGYKHVDTLALDVPYLAEERVGDSATDTGTIPLDTEKQHSTTVTWADVVRGYKQEAVKERQPVRAPAPAALHFEFLRE